MHPGKEPQYTFRLFRIINTVCEPPSETKTSLALADTKRNVSFGYPRGFC